MHQQPPRRRRRLSDGRRAGGVAELDSDGLGRTTFNNDGAVCSAKEGRQEGRESSGVATGLPPSIPPSIPPTRNAAHPEKWSCGQSPERGRRKGRAVWLLFSGFVRYSKAAEVIQSTIFRQISMTSSPPACDIHCTYAKCVGFCRMTSKMSRGEGSREANLGGGDARRTLARVDGWRMGGEV